MSILIKGLIMPSCCDGCTFSDWSNLHQTASCKLHDYDPCFADHSREYTDKRADFCPLVEIPEPHGRLIDGDAYCENLLEEAHKVWRLLKPETIERINRTVDDLKKYPAIIEAEGSENHDD